MKNENYMSAHFIRLKSNGDMESVVRMSDGYEHILSIPKYISTADKQEIEIGVMEYAQR